VTTPLSPDLLTWYRAGHRDLPWRRTRDPYAIWVSEIMLQQTQVATVIPYFQRFMARFPAVSDLAAAPTDEVLRLWAGLGYYSRARNLQRGAQAVMEQHGGRVPDRVEELLRLPGVGRYTAGAIASIAHGQPAPILDGNVIRVLCRLYALRGDPKRAPLHTRLWHLAETLIPPGEAGDFNQSLMELGATVCTPASPRCELCPVAAHCEARRLGIQESLPELPRAAAPTPLLMVAAVIWRRSELLLIRKPTASQAVGAEASEDRSWWTGMWQLPTGRVREGESTAAAAARLARDLAGLEVTVEGIAGSVRHGVTRYRITLEARHCRPIGPWRSQARCPRSPDGAGGRWASLEDTDGLGLPAPQRRLIEQLRKSARDGGDAALGQIPLLEV
jgi:A/G-specific adenine glycosylase